VEIDALADKEAASVYTEIEALTTERVRIHRKEVLKMMCKIDIPNGWRLPESLMLRRMPARSVKWRVNDFDKKFDDSTLAYDIAYIAERKMAYLSCPPFNNLLEKAKEMQVCSAESGLPCAFEVLEMNRHARVAIKIPSGTTAINISSELGSVRLPVNTDENDFFKDRRVLMTMSKDNRIEWICDWIRYYRDVHQIDAVLLYDNNSTSYDMEDLRNAILGIAGIQAVCIVKWNYKYGPQGFNGGHWDSDYCQSGAMENARWKYLQKAKSVINVDVDELVMPCEKSVMEMVERSVSGYLVFQGKWVIRTANDSIGREKAIRHRDFSNVLITRLGLQPWKSFPLFPCMLHKSPRKWAAVPHQIPEVHSIRNIKNRRKTDSRVQYRHFRPINTSWNQNRCEVVAFDPKLHYVDHGLKAAMDMVCWSK
jgi:hypothetical protein